MGEAQVVVTFFDDEGNIEYRTFSLDVGPDDTYLSIANRLADVLERYETGQLDWTPREHDFLPYVDPITGLDYFVITWPDFTE